MTASVATAQIARMACLQLEVTAPSSLEDDSDLARDLLAFYPDAVDRCLEACDWSFQTRIVALPALTDLPPNFAADADLPHVYAYPDDARSIAEVGTGRVRWRRDVVGIRADVPPPLRLVYTSTSPQESRWPAEFRAAVGFTLATYLAPKYLEIQSKVERLEQRAAAALKQAMRNSAADASSARYDGLPEQDDWVAEARR